MLILAFNSQKFCFVVISYILVLQKYNDRGLFQTLDATEQKPDSTYSEYVIKTDSAV
jgi:hypothetical protein